MVALNRCHACSVSGIKSDITLANDDEIMYKTLATDELYNMGSQRCIIVERRVSVVYSRAVLSCRSFGCEIGNVPACDNYESPQLLDQRTRTLMQVSDLPGCTSVCFSCRKRM